MSGWWGAAVLVVTALSSLLAKWMDLRFLRRIYDRGGAKDLKLAAESLRGIRAWNTTREVLGKRLRRKGDPDSS